MARKILIINGSLRVGGNTDKILVKVKGGIEKKDIDVTVCLLRDKKFEDCKGCYYCNSHKICSIKDDMHQIHNEIQNSDLMILASPLYFWGVTGIMKTFIDRLYLYYPQRNAKLLNGKKAIILTPMHVSETEHGLKAFKSEIEPLSMMYKYTLNRLGVKIIDMIYYPGLRKKDDIDKNSAYLNDAYMLGLNINNL